MKCRREESNLQDPLESAGSKPAAFTISPLRREVPQTGLEPARPFQVTRISALRVFQFHHRGDNARGRNRTYKSKGDWFTASGTHHLSNSSVSSATLLSLMDATNARPALT